MTSDITEDDLLNAIRKHMEEPQETDEHDPFTFTTAELAALMKITTRRARSKAKLLCEQGILSAEYVTRTSIWGKRLPRPGFKYIGGEHDTSTETS